MSEDYIFVAYSGHGGFKRSSSSTVIELKGVDYDESILVNSRCSWQLNILDTCRSIIKEQQLTKGYKVLNEAISGVTIDTSVFFLNAFSDLEKGLMRVYSAGVGEADDDGTNVGLRDVADFTVGRTVGARATRSTRSVTRTPSSSRLRGSRAGSMESRWPPRAVRALRRFRA